jgi:hypothetical protein
MSNSKTDPAAYPLFLWPQSGNNDRDLEGCQNPRVAYNENEARDSGAYESPNGGLTERQRGMYSLPQSSSFSTLPNEVDDEDGKAVRIAVFEVLG